MKNILNIIRHDLKRLGASVVAIITIMGLCIIPCLYAWFNIFSNWAPYESSATGRIAVAVANEDKGTDLMGLEINVGDKLETALRGNDVIGWTFVDSEEEAKEGVYAGKYYAALAIPEDFSRDVLSFVKGDLTNPVIKYYENEKKNAVAPKITGKAKKALQEEINAAFVGTLAGYVSQAASVADAGGIDAEDLLSEMSEKVDTLSRDIDNCIALSKSASGLTDSAEDLLEVSDTFIGSTQDVITANDKLLADIEKQLSMDGRTEKEALKHTIKLIKAMGTTLNGVKDVTLVLLSADVFAFNRFVRYERDNWVTKVEKMKTNAEEQSAFLKKEGLTALSEQFDKLAEALGAISADLKALQTGMDLNERHQALSLLSTDIDLASELANTIIDQINKDIDKDLETAFKNVRKTISTFRGTMSGAGKEIGSVGRTLDKYGTSLSELQSSIDKTSASLRDVQTGADSVSGLLSNTSGNELLQKLNDLMDNDEEAVAEYLSDPIKMETKVFWPIDEFGSAMAPFYTVLAQWVGALLTAALIKVRIKERGGLKDLKLTEKFFGRYGLYLMIGLTQALIVSLGDILYIGIQCQYPLKFVLAALVNGLVFSMINYALVFAFDSIGLGISVIILLLQVPGSGGIFPVEVLPTMFRALNPLMPFRYAMNAMRECIGGMYEDTYVKCLGTMMLYFLLAVVLGLLLYIPSRKLNEMIAASKAKSEIML